MSHWLRRPMVGAVAIGLLAGTTVALFLVPDAVATRGWPTERAEVVAIEDSGGLIDGCVRSGGPARDVTLVSADPPPGLDAEIVLEDECHTHDSFIGEVWRLTRVVDEDGSVTVHSSPMSTSEAVRTALYSGAGCFVVAFAGLVGAAAWRRRRARPRECRYDTR